MPHQTEIKVRFSELDPYSHVNHAVYITYFEVARSEALVTAGIPLEMVGEAGYHFLVVELATRFKHSAVAGDTLTVETWLSGIGRASTRWSQRILRDGEVLTTQEVRVGMANSQGRPTRPPAFILDALGSGPITEPPGDLRGS